MSKALNLHDANAMLPSLDAAAKSAASLKAAIFEKISETDVGDIMAGVVERAKKGDEKSIKILLDWISKGTPQVSVGLRLNPSANGKGNGHARQTGQARLIAIADRVADCAEAIAVRGPLTLSGLANATRYDAPAIQDAITGHDWFCEDERGKWTLTAEGEKYVKAKGE